MMFNSLVTALVIAFGKIAISLLSAFAIVYFRFPFRTFVVLDDLRHADAAGRGAHPADVQGGLRPAHDRHLRRPDLPLIASATATFLFRQFFLTIPDELAEAARIDGAGPMRFFWDVVVPLSRPNIAALFVILFIYGWNQYLWPLLDHDARRTCTRRSSASSG